MSETHCTPGQRDSAAAPDAAALDDQLDQSILSLLLTSQFPGLWSVQELAREIGKSTEVLDAVARLHRQGLIHRLDDFVFVTHAVACYDQLQY